MVQAAWACVQHEQAKAAGQKGNFGLPNFDKLEGWIVSA
jgi:hypothetical protein